MTAGWRLVILPERGLKPATTSVPKRSTELVIAAILMGQLARHVGGCYKYRYFVANICLHRSVILVLHFLMAAPYRACIRSAHVLMAAPYRACIRSAHVLMAAPYRACIRSAHVLMAAPYRACIRSAHGRGAA